MVKPWRPRTGEAALYVSRAKALRRLGVSLADFRKLCILKGIFPRVPKRKLAGRDKTYYHVKDITHLAHEPLLQTFRDEKVAKRRVRKAVCKKEFHTARSIAERALTYTNRPSLTHIIKERYPSLEYALGDLDDALSCIALFATLPVASEDSITGELAGECRELLDQWMALIANQGCLDKVFASIKGYYYQVTVKGIKIVWLSPHEFPTSKDNDVDLKVMATFLQLYTELLRFVLFKLYQIAGFQYPPSHRITDESRLAAARWLNLTLTRCTSEEDTNPLARATETKLQRLDDEAKRKRTLFGQQTFYVSRETPVWQVVFCLKACGAKVIGFDEPVIDANYHQSLSDVDMHDASITHHVVDRPESALKALNIPKSANRILIVPQWVFDCINVVGLLPTVPYRPGVTPPPHLSPFIDDEAEGYVPEQRKVLEEWSGRSVKDSMALIGAEVETTNEILHKQSSEVKAEHEEIAAIVEATAVATTSDVSAKSDLDSKLKKIRVKKDQKQAETERVRGKMALPRKKRQMYDRVEKREEKEKANVKKLLERKRERK